ncbi:MAG: hypothetical protein AAFO07_25795 [Bacteroidota bacterium]
MGADFSFLKIKASNRPTLKEMDEQIEKVLLKEGYKRVQEESDSSYSYILIKDTNGFYHFSDIGTYEQQAALTLSAIGEGLFSLDVSDEAWISIGLYIDGKLEDAYKTSTFSYHNSKDKENFDQSIYQVDHEIWNKLTPYLDKAKLLEILPHPIIYERPKDNRDNLLSYGNLMENLTTHIGWNPSLNKAVYQYDVEGLPGCGLYLVPDDCNIIYGHYVKEGDTFRVSNYFEEEDE